MKYCTLFFSFIFIGSIANAQDWVKYKNKPDANFYEVQQSFNKHWKKHERKEKLKQFFSFTDTHEEESEGLMLYKRWEYSAKPRVYPSGDLNLLHETGKEIEKVIANPSYRSALQANGNWQPLGAFDVPSDGGGAGRLNCVRFHPTQPNTIFVGAPVGGLWKSTDGGSSWTVMTNTLPSLAVSDVAIDANNPNIMYLASGDFDADDAPGVGVLKSTDGGISWQITGLNFMVSQGRYISRIIIDPTNSNIVWAAASNGVYKSTNAGVNWTKVITSSNLRDLELKPGTNNVLYATSNTSFYKSVDAGNTFSVISTGLPLSSSSSRMAIAVTPDNPEVVYLVSSNTSDNGFKGLYKSVDSGNSFSLKSSEPNLLGWDSDGNDSGGQGWYTLSIAASPINENEVSIGGVNIWSSFDGGENWEITAHWTGDNGTPYVHADIHDLAYKPNTGLLFTGCDGGIFKSNAGLSSWTDLSDGLQIGQMYKLGCSASNSSLVLQGWQDNGTNQYDAGQWAQVIGGDGMECFVDWSNTNYQYGEMQYGNIRRSSNGGNSFTGIKNNINEDGEWVTPWTQHPSTANTLFAGYKNVWKSTNRGTSWTKISNLNIGGLTILKVAKSNPSYIYVSNSTSIFKTTDGGANWNSVVVPNAGSNAITDIAIDETNPDKVWITRSGYSASIKVFKTTDGGVTWQNLSNGLPNIPVNTVVNQTGTNDGIYVGTDFGVYYYDEQILMWVPYMNGLPNVRVDELEIQYSSSKLRAATYGRGLWESSIYNPNSQLPFANFSANVLSGCPGFTVQFSDNSFGNPSSWLWSFPGGTPSTSTDQNPIVTYNNAGTYNDVQLIIQNAFGIDSITKLNYISVSPAIVPVITLNNNDTLCQGESVILKTNNAQSYFWYPNNFGNSSFSTDTSGVYAVKTTDVFGCATYSDTVTIVVLPVQQLTVTSSNDTLFTNASGNIQWYFNGALITGATGSYYVAENAGTYSAILTESNGCTSASNNLITNIKNIEIDNPQIEIFPNPSAGRFFFTYSNNRSNTLLVKIIDMEGKLVDEKLISSKDQNNGQYQMNCEHLPAGNYILTISTDKVVLNKKISITKPDKN
jgi:PKD repeat protein